MKMLQDVKKDKNKKTKKINEFLIKYIFCEIDQEGSNLVSKNEIFQYIKGDKDIITAFDL